MLAIDFCQAQILSGTWRTVYGTAEHLQGHHADKTFGLAVVERKDLSRTCVKYPPAFGQAVPANIAGTILHLMA